MFNCRQRQFQESTFLDSRNLRYRSASSTAGVLSGNIATGHAIGTNLAFLSRGWCAFYRPRIETVRLSKFVRCYKKYKG